MSLTPSNSNWQIVTLKSMALPFSPSPCVSLCCAHIVCVCRAVLLSEIGKLKSSLAAAQSEFATVASAVHTLLQ